MMDIQVAAIYLLALRLLSSGFIISVLYIQVPLLHIKDEESTLRKLLFALAVSLLCMNLIPVIIDVGTIFGDLERSAKALAQFSLYYSFSNAIFSVISAFLVWGIYQYIRIRNEKR